MLELNSNSMNAVSSQLVYMSRRPGTPSRGQEGRDDSEAAGPFGLSGLGGPSAGSSKHDLINIMGYTARKSPSEPDMDGTSEPDQQETEVPEPLEPEGARIFTCTVHKKATRANHFLSDTNDVAFLIAKFAREIRQLDRAQD